MDHCEFLWQLLPTGRRAQFIGLGIGILSGIAAVIRVDGQTVDLPVISAMTAAMNYRGPDGIAHWTSGSVGLGHCTMHTTKESLDSRQPLVSENGALVLVMDGYLTNCEELRRDLHGRGVRLRDHSDAQLILRAYETWGEECPRHIDGEYAFVIWNGRKREAFCAVDHKMLRQLFYYWDGKVLLVASDVAGVLAALPQCPQLNRGFLAEVMANEWLTRDETAWTGIKRLVPAHWLRLRSTSLETREYWTLPSETRIRYSSDGEYFEHYRELFAGCVRSASRTHLPLAIDASGGLDSSAVLAMAVHLKKDGRLLAPEIRGYSFIAPKGSAADELEYVRDLASFLGMPITEVPLFTPAMSWFARQTSKDRDLAPYANTAMIVGLGERLRKDGCRVSLNGQGGDHWLTGNRNYYYEAVSEGEFRELLDCLKEDVAAHGVLRSLRMLFRSGVIPAVLPDWLYMTLRKLANFESNPVDEKYWLADDLQDELRQRRKLTASKSRRPQLVYKAAKLNHPFQLRFFETFSRQCARIGYEPRSPMFSRSFIEFFAATPERMRLRGNTDKFIHRRAIGNMLPPAIRDRKTKAEFSCVYERHIEALGKLCTIILPREPRGLVCEKGIKRFFESCRSASVDEPNFWELWGVNLCVLMFDDNTKLVGGNDDVERT